MDILNDPSSMFAVLVSLSLVLGLLELISFGSAATEGGTRGRNVFSQPLTL